MVRKNNNPKASGNDYVYGSTAYDYDKHKKIDKSKKPVQKSKVKNKKSKSKKLRLVLCVGVIFFMAFITVGRYTTILTLSSNVREQRKSIEEIQKSNQDIKVKLAKLNDTKAIEEVAINKYNMVYPTNENTYFISVKPLSDKSKKIDKKESALTTMQRILGLIY